MAASACPKHYDRGFQQQIKNVKRLLLLLAGCSLNKPPDAAAAAVAAAALRRSGGPACFPGTCLPLVDVHVHFGAVAVNDVELLKIFSPSLSHQTQRVSATLMLIIHTDPDPALADGEHQWQRRFMWIQTIISGRNRSPSSTEALRHVNMPSLSELPWRPSVEQTASSFQENRHQRHHVATGSVWVRIRFSADTNAPSPRGSWQEPSCHQSEFLLMLVTRTGTASKTQFVTSKENENEIRAENKNMVFSTDWM
ncbi:uncharacterized protein V6R79_020570 [Siganus canaliculatus]